MEKEGTAITSANLCAQYESRVGVALRRYLADALELGALRTNVINELWHGNIIPQEDSRNNSKEMKELLGHMARHHEDLAKTFTDEQKEIFEKFHDCWDEYVSLAEAAIFEYAFRLGARLTMEIHKDEE